MRVPGTQHRVESGFTMSQAGWQRLVACGSHLGDAKRYVLGLLLSPVAHHRANELATVAKIHQQQF